MLQAVSDDWHVLQNGACCTHRTKAGPFVRMHNAAQGNMEKHPGLITLRFWINYWCYIWRPTVTRFIKLHDHILLHSPTVGETVPWSPLQTISFQKLTSLISSRVPASTSAIHTIPCLCFTPYIPFYFSYGPKSLILELKMTMNLYLDSVLWGLTSCGNHDPPTKDEPCRLFLPRVSVCLGLNQEEAPFQLESPSGAFTVKWKSKKTKWFLQKRGRGRTRGQVPDHSLEPPSSCMKTTLALDAHMLTHAWGIYAKHVQQS